jgi:hypothetical protein
MHQIARAHKRIKTPKKRPQTTQEKHRQWLSTSTKIQSNCGFRFAEVVAISEKCRKLLVDLMDAMYC